MKRVVGDLLEAKDYSLVVHQVNPRVLGPVLALSLGNKYRGLSASFYSKASSTTPLVLGEVQLVLVDPARTVYVANCCAQITTLSSTNNTDYQALERCLDTCISIGMSLGLLVRIPAGIGCGMAGGDIREVGLIFDRLAIKYPDADVEIVSLS